VLRQAVPQNLEAAAPVARARDDDLAVDWNAPLDSALLDDSRVYHGVTPVMRLDPRLPAYRDVLVVTFRRE